MPRKLPDVGGFDDMTHALQVARDAIDAAREHARLLLINTDDLMKANQERTQQHLSRVDLRPHVVYKKPSAIKFSVSFNDTTYFYGPNEPNGGDILTWWLKLGDEQLYDELETKHDALLQATQHYYNAGLIPEEGDDHAT